MATQESGGSARLTFLQKEIEAGNASALDAFWQEITQQGAPLIETIEDDSTHVLVTFLWRADGQISNVVVLGDDLIGKSPTENAMQRLLDTNLWYKTFRLRADLRFEYLLSPNDPELLGNQSETWQARTASWQADPLNPKHFLLPDDGDHSEWKDFFGSRGSTWVNRVNSLVELPAAPPQPEITRQPDVPKGQLEKHRLPSAILGNSRWTYVYTPPSYSAVGEPYDLLVLFDAWLYLDILPAPIILDNLLAKGTLPPLVGVLVDVSHLLERGEIVQFPTYVDFVKQELVPWIRQNYHVTTNPARTIVGGCSLSGVTAAYTALRCPDIFGNVLSQSGWFTWKRNDEPESEWVARQFAQSPYAPVRFYMEVGQFETWSSPDPNQLISNRHLRTVLQAKGNQVDYREFAGEHQAVCMRGTLADGLVSLIGSKR